ncbi:hypothetical protein [Nocardiopsis synnemataformans]|uniref:hypothetical protein n=1 Tax=Nocardiopsis synnemataformans TaxID=61305 RepID=UPI003EB9A1DE
MVNRVTLENGPEYHNYGGRGIRVCERWESFGSFEEDMGPTFSPELQLDRIDVNGDYSPQNCRWATPKEQQRNKRTNHVVEWSGLSMTVQDWAELLSLKPNTVVHRLRRGWSVKRALTKNADPDALATVISQCAGHSEVANP